MEISVVAFATAGDVLGKEPVLLKLPDGSGLEGLRHELVRRYPALEPIWPRLAVAVDGELVGAEARLAPGCEVALLPPVSGGSGTPRWRLTEEPIDPAEVANQVAHPRRGAVLLFLGNVRNHHQGRPVQYLTYSAYRPMAERALENIVRQLEAGGDDLRLAIVHRLGKVRAGETSVVIAVASPHREAAYSASRKALERLKREAPIWKQEHFADGEAAWREVEDLRRPAEAPA